MPARVPFLVTATGVVTDPVTGLNYFALSPADTDFFVGVSDPPGTSTYNGLTLQVQGSRDGVTYYDIATYTTDMIGPLATPLSPADNSNTAYIGDCRAFTRIQVNVLTLNGSVNLEVLTGSFFSQRANPGNGAQVVYALRYLAAILTGWLGPPAGPLPAIQPPLVGTNPGGSFPGGE